MMKLFVLAALVACTFAKRQEFIVGGANADIADFPWQGSYRTASNSHTCGCVLVGSNWALTAAHCGGSSSFSTEWGNTNRNTGPYVAVSEVTLHPNYGQGEGAFPNDISVIALAGSTAGTPITMASTEIESGAGQISGWGRTCGSCALPITLQAVNIPVITDAECTARWGNNYNGEVHVCVWDETNQDIGACNGDSGGPMVANGVLHGITSWGSTGCDTTFPSAYTRVSTFQSWACGITGDAAEGC